MTKHGAGRSTGECIAGGEHNIISTSSNFEEPNKFYGKCSKCGEFAVLNIISTGGGK